MKKGDPHPPQKNRMNKKRKNGADAHVEDTTRGDDDDRDPYEGISVVDVLRLGKKKFKKTVTTVPADVDLPVPAPVTSPKKSTVKKNADKTQEGVKRDELEESMRKIKENLAARTEKVPELMNGETLDMNKLDVICKIIENMQGDKTDVYEVSRMTRLLIEKNIMNMFPEEKTFPSYRLMSMNKMTHQMIFNLIHKYNMNHTPPTPKLSKKEATAEMVNRVVFPTCTRAHHDSQLFEPLNTERKCIKDAMCSCKNDFGFIMKEFLTYEEEEEQLKTNTHKNVHGLCLYCIREEVTLQYTFAVVMKVKVEDKFSFQHHLIYVNIPGEYHQDDCICPGEISAYPQIMNSKDIYRVSKINDRRCLIQCGLKKIEAQRNPFAITPDFHSGVLQ